jgi:hypothetical protein
MYQEIKLVVVILIAEVIIIGVVKAFDYWQQQRVQKRVQK